MNERALRRFQPVTTETREVDGNGFCPECHVVATSWGDLLAKNQDAAAEVVAALRALHAEEADSYAAATAALERWDAKASSPPPEPTNTEQT